MEPITEKEIRVAIEYLKPLLSFRGVIKEEYEELIVSRGTGQVVLRVPDLENIAIKLKHGRGRYGNLLETAKNLEQIGIKYVPFVPLWVDAYPFDQEETKGHLSVEVPEYSDTPITNGMIVRWVDGLQEYVDNKNQGTIPNDILEKVAEYHQLIGDFVDGMRLQGQQHSGELEGTHYYLSYPYGHVDLSKEEIFERSLGIVDGELLWFDWDNHSLFSISP
jgi:hypothetical protein